MTSKNIPVKFFLTEEAKKAGCLFAQPKEGDAGFDIRAAAPVTIPPRSQASILTGLHMAIPLGWVGIVKDRSSMASKRQTLRGGVIDASYRGELKLIMANDTDEPYTVDLGAKVAQIIFFEHLTTCEEVSSLEELGQTERGQKGFGSSGK